MSNTTSTDGGHMTEEKTTLSDDEILTSDLGTRSRHETMDTDGTDDDQDGTDTDDTDSDADGQDPS
jgi:hypothetical protein